MLFKHDSTTARGAAFFPSAALKPSAQDEPVAQLPSPEELALARLEQENTSLSAQLHALQEGWDNALAAAAESARAEAASEHVRADQQLASALAAALEQANVAFAQALQGEIAPTAISLAESAFSRLAILRAADCDWLARLIERRLGEMQAKVPVEICIAPGALAAGETDHCAEVAVRELLPPGACITVDPTLPLGTAKINLRLGGVPIDPADGLARVRAAFADETADV